MNGAPEHQRSPRVPGGRAGEKLHPGGGAARCFTIRAQPYDPRPGGAARPAAVDPHHPQRRADGGRRAPDADGGAEAGRDRRRAFRTDRAARQAGRHRPHHRSRAFGRNDPLACLGNTAAAISRHQGGGEHRLRLHRHRRGAFRRRRSSRRAGGKGHDRGAHRTGFPHGGGRHVRLFRCSPQARQAAGPRGP